MKPRPSALAVRIRRLMLADDDVGKVAAATPGVIGESVCVHCLCVHACVRAPARGCDSKTHPSPPTHPTGRALELFLDHLVKAAAALMNERGDKMLTAGHFKAAVAADPVFDFCRALLADAPDLPDPAAKKKKGGGGGGGDGAKRKIGGGKGGSRKKAKKEEASSDDDDDDDGSGSAGPGSSAEPAPDAPAAAPTAAPPAEEFKEEAVAASVEAAAPPADAPPPAADPSRSDVVPMPPLDNAADYVQFEDDFDA